MALAQGGQRVLLVEAGVGLGGTCLFEGCIPSKIFRDAAARRFEISGAATFGIGTKDGAAAGVDWRVVQARKQHVLAARAGAALTSAHSLPTLEVVFGHARLNGPHRAIVEGSNGSTEVAFDRAILATGSVPKRLPIQGAMLPGVMTSEGLIEIERIPASLVLIGGGPIGVEMASIFTLLGSRVTLLEAAARILEPADEVLARRLKALLEGDGIVIETAVSVDDIRQSDGELQVRYHAEATQRTATGTIVAMAVGRGPNVAGLGLESTRVRYDDRRVYVNGSLETDESGIYATGDLVGQPMFAHWATAQALAVARHLCGQPVVYPRPETNSAVVFSRPELGMSGRTFESAKTDGIPVAVAEYDYRVDARAQISNEKNGWLRIVYRTDNHQIVGVHALIEGASDLMGEAALAIKSGCTLETLAQTIHPHPTLTEAFGAIARSVLSQPVPT
jgi:dihydrolipoamide dehydrogenase